MSPRVEHRRNSAGHFSVIEESGSHPVLMTMENIYQLGNSFVVPAFSGGFIFLRTRIDEGPANNIERAGASSSTIQWNMLTGWTRTGGNWCNANPTCICDLANRVRHETSDPVLYPALLDVDPWVFHGTGWADSEGSIARTAMGGSTGICTDTVGELRDSVHSTAWALSPCSLLFLHPPSRACSNHAGWDCCSHPVDGP